MAAPTFVGAGTGVVVTTGNANFTKTGVTVGNLIMTQVLIDGGVFSALTLTTTGGSLENLAGTDNALTLHQAASYGSSNGFNLSVGRALSTTVTANAATSGADLYCRVYEFANASAGTTLATVFDQLNISPEGSGTTVSDTGVTTVGPDRLACNWIYMNDDATLPAFTGQTGGTWVDAAQFASATGTDGAITLQTAAMASAGTINGGSATASVTVEWLNIGTAIIGTTVAGDVPHKPLRAEQAVMRSNVY